MSETGRGHEQDERFAQRFIDAVDSVRGYNDRHAGMTGIMSTFLSGVFEEHGGGAAGKVSRIDEANMQKELVALLQTDELQAMGVSLVDPSDFTAADPEADTASRSRGHKERDAEYPVSLIMLISDTDAFTETLHKLKPSPGQKEAAQTGVDVLLISMIALIRATEHTENPPDTSEEEAAGATEQVLDAQIGAFMAINPALVERGFDGSQAYEKLSDYAARHASGTLPDYLGAESLGLLDTDFGPDKWPMDMGAGRLNEKWGQAFAYLKELRDREDPSPYFTELFNKLRSDFDTARAWLEAGDDPEAPAQRPDAEYIDPLKAMTVELAKIWEEEFPLENAYYLSEKAEASK